MKLRKSNSYGWLALGLALLLLGGSLAASTGTAYARYRAEKTIPIPFSVRAPEPVYLGVWETGEDGVTQIFTQKDSPQWETTGEISTLHFVAANGTGTDDFLTEDQQIRVRLVGTLGLQNPDTDTPPVITLSIPKTVTAQSEDPETASEEAGESAGSEEQFETYTAVVSPITADSALGKSFGQGWVFTFQESVQVTDENGKTTVIQGKELSWTLEGGKFSTQDMKLTIQNAKVAEISLLNLQVIGE